MHPITTPQYNEKEMHKNWPEHTICQVHRELYWLMDNIPDKKIQKKARQKILLAYTMAKHMEKGLRRIKRNWDKGLWEKTE